MKMIFLVVGLLISSTVLAQKGVSNVRTEQQDSILYVFYDLNTSSDVSLYFSIDDGKTFSGPLSYVSGDVGSGVKAGSEKLIVWDIVKELGYIDIKRAKVKVVADLQKVKTPKAPKRPRQLEWRTLALVGTAFNSNQLSYTLMFGQVKRFGWYGKLKTDFNFNFSNSDGVSWNHTGFWNGKSNNGRYAVTAGALWNMCRPLMLYAGAGYGKRWLDWETIGNKKIRIDDYSYDGAEVELGVITHLKRFLLSAGVSINTDEISANSWEMNVGIGYTF